MNETRENGHSENKGWSDGKSKKLRLSIVYKLNTKLFLRMFAIFLTLDFFLVLASGLFFMVTVEQRLAIAAEQIRAEGLPGNHGEPWLGLGDIRFDAGEGEATGWKMPDLVKPIFPDATRDGYRSLSVEELEYHYTESPTMQDQDHPAFRLTYSLTGIGLLLRNIFYALVAIESILLLGSIASGARMIRSTLQPIADLALVTQSLNEGGGASIEKMERLADKLASINVSRLDTRISMEETQDELKGLANAINGLLDRINASYRAQARFVSDASHELRTPISVIQGYANLLDRWGKNDPTTLQESIEAIKEETENMKSLVEQLLFLARSDNNTVSLDLEEISLTELILEVAKETQMIDSGHQVETIVEATSIVGDRGLIKQAMRILVDNAMKYTNPGGQITLSIRQEDGLVRLTVQDEGIGIPADAVPKIFDRFYRTDESRNRASGGTGLGLSIAKWIAERHGGHMEVLSRQSIGTRISLVLPITKIQTQTHKATLSSEGATAQ